MSYLNSENINSHIIFLNNKLKKNSADESDLACILLYMLNKVGFIGVNFEIEAIYEKNSRIQRNNFHKAQVNFCSLIPIMSLRLLFPA